MASRRLIATLAGVVASLSLSIAAHGAQAACVGRYALTKARGPLVSTQDFVALDEGGAVLDPACGSAATRTRRTRRRVRIDARWPECRGRRLLRVRLDLTADCTVMRGTARAPGAGKSTFDARGSRCGDGIVDPALGERCDDGNVVAGDLCDEQCGRCTDPSTLPSTWAAVQANVFDPYCTSCHRDHAIAGLDLRPPDAYSRIVGVPSEAAGFSIPLVTPGDRNASYLWLKMADGAIPGAADMAGSPMPFGSPLPVAIVEALGRWIDAGAPADGLVDGAEALRPPCD